MIVFACRTTLPDTLVKLFLNRIEFFWRRHGSHVFAEGVHGRDRSPHTRLASALIFGLRDKRSHGLSILRDQKRLFKA
jgi:hypothetical protein